MANPMPQPDPTKVVARRVVAAIIDALLVVVPAILIYTASLEYTTSTTLEDTELTGEQFCSQYLDVHPDGVCTADLVDVAPFDAVYYSNSSNVGSTGFYWISNFLILVVLQGFTGWSPGKLILGIRVIREDGGKPGFVKALTRWVMWIADGFPYVIPGLTGFIVASSTPGHRRIGDLVARTFVVKRAFAGTPMRIEDGGRLVVGAEGPTAVEPAWATPPGAPDGWGAAVDPNAAGWASPAPPAGTTPPPTAPPVAAPQASAPSTEGPQWDEARGTYIQWDPAQQAWMQWDEGFKAWTVIPGQ
jgi:uncharacterized RDD family membrane protein YckC